VRDIWAAGGTGRFNLLLTDGEVIAATAAGDTLFWRRREGGVVVASEPSDDDPDWAKVPDDSVVEATAGRVAVWPIAAATTAPGDGPPRGNGLPRGDGLSHGDGRSPTT